MTQQNNGGVGGSSNVASREGGGMFARGGGPLEQTTTPISSLPRPHPGQTDTERAKALKTLGDERMCACAVKVRPCFFFLLLLHCLIFFSPLPLLCAAAAVYMEPSAKEDILQGQDEDDDVGGKKCHGERERRKKEKKSYQTSQTNGWLSQRARAQSQTSPPLSAGGWEKDRQACTQTGGGKEEIFPRMREGKSLWKRRENEDTLRRAFDWAKKGLGGTAPVEEDGGKFGILFPLRAPFLSFLPLWQ